MTKTLTATEIRNTLQQSPVLLGSIIHTAMDAIIVMDQDQRILIFNPAAEKMFQYSADEVKGKPLTILIPERFHAGHIEDVLNFGRTARTKRSPEKLGLVFGVRATGEEFPLEAAISQVEVNGRKFFTAILHDIRERERTEKDLQQSFQKAERSQRLLHALSEAGNAIQRVHTSSEIGQAILDELFGLGYRAAILVALQGDPGHLVVSNLSHPVKALEVIEKMAGVTTKGFRLPVNPGSLFDQVLQTGKTDFSVADVSLYENILPKNLHSLAGTIQKTLGIKAGITARLTRGNETYGLLTVAGDDLSEADLPAMTTFATQASIALDNLRLLETVRQKEEHFRLLVEQLPAVTYQDIEDSHPGDFVTAFISPQVETLLGYPAEKFIADSGLWYQLIHSEDHDRVVKRNAEHYVTRQPNRDEYRMITRFGDVIWVRDESIILTSEDGGKLFSQGVVFDITEQKQAEEALQISENRFQGAFEYAAIGMGLVATDGHWLRVNRALCELLGYTKEELLEKTFQDITHPDDLDADLAFVEQLLAGTIQSYQMEKRYFQRSGQIVWVLLNVSLIRDDQGEPLYFISQIENITDRKQTEEDLRTSETRYRELFEDSPVSLWEEDFSAVKQRLDTLRREGVTDFEEYFIAHPEVVTECEALIKVLDVNKTTLGLFGTERKADILKNLAEIFGGEPIQIFKGELVNIAEGKTRFRWEGRNKTIDGRLIDVDLNWSAAPGYEESLSKVIVSMIDITERKRAEDMLVAERDLLSTLINTLPDNIFIKDVTGRIVINNKAHQHTLGAITLEQVVGKTDFDFFPREQAARYDAEEKRIVQSGRSLIDQLDPFIDKDHNQHWLLTTKVPLRDRRGIITGIVGFNRDITDRKRAEDLLMAERDLQTTLINTLPDNIFIKDVTGRVVLDNTAHQRALGTNSLEQVVGKTDFDFFPEELAAQYDADEKQVIQSGEPLIDKVEPYIDKDHNQHWLLTTKVPLRDRQRNIIGIVGFNHDITDRKAAEEKLAEERNLLRTLIDNLPDRIMAMDTLGRKTLTNRGDWQASGGKSMEDVIGKTDLELYPLELATEFWALDKEVLNSGMPIINHEEGGLDIDGNPVWVLSTKIPLRDEQGKVVGLVGIGRDITERKQAGEKIQRQLERLAALRAIDQVIISSFDLRNSLTEILKHVTKELSVDAGDVLLLNTANLFLEYNAGVGFRTPPAGKISVRLGQSYAGRVALERQLIQIPNLKDNQDDLFLKTQLAGEGFVCYFGVPLIAKGSVMGVLEVYHRTLLKPDREWLEFLNTLADQAALAIDNTHLFENLQRSNIDLTLAYDATIEGWSKAMDLRDKETEGHTQRVTEMTMELAGLFGIKDDELIGIRRGALLHDIGKMGVPDAILLKPEALTDEEWVSMRKHPTFAFEMLSPIHYLKSAIDIPYCHHEKWDGTGYPRGLKGDQIPLPARIFAIVDVWDAVTSDRPYRKGWSKEKAIEYIRSQAGSHFDPQIVQVCLESGVFDRKGRN